MGNVREVAMAANPAARIVYVDHDPVVLAHARNTPQGTPGGLVPEPPSDCYYYALVARKP
jgi:S-adenosyl methyltransferase